jgi:hypothetical protein
MYILSCWARIIRRSSATIPKSAFVSYLLDPAGHRSQSKALEPFAGNARSFKPLDPAVSPILENSDANDERKMKKGRLSVRPVLKSAPLGSVAVPGLGESPAKARLLHRGVEQGTKLLLCERANWTPNSA